MQRCLLLVIVCSLFAGCGPTAVKMVPVSGIVTAEGRPLSYGNVTLIPDAANGNKSKLQPRGTIGADGRYTLETDGKPGAPLGIYVVTVHTIKPSTPEDGYKPPVWAASPDYGDPSKSGLGLTVIEGAHKEAYDIELVKR